MFKADAVLHFGTHGSLEFMPGKQVGLAGTCYPDSLISTIPNLYYYAANNPSEVSTNPRARSLSFWDPPGAGRQGACCCVSDRRQALA